ncbi:MAG: efflux RND transporter periplasmic adaptor subunit [Bacteroidales bacterium]|nr:efflux RND transporter periplasmic adaptor subunit [Bacteroidales bacterium]HOY37955.1 efflux RND transporter periplasmic adaptor subunit [Bacteroidales bacterium]HQP03188.1 efflux RND transporter periplasmic adaptor subunit [Bacteroidales bacterium]
MKTKRKKLYRWLILGLIVLIVLLIVARKAGWMGGEEINKVSVDKVAKRTIVETVTANGKIQPEMEVKISPDVSGEIVELDVKEGQQVKKGQFLLKIKPDLYESAVDRSIAALNGAKANLSNSRARLEQTQAQFNQTELAFNRNQKLFDQGAISQAEYENSLASYQMGMADLNAARENVKAAEFTVMSAEATVKEANENLYKTSIYAPVDGTISLLNVELGERVVGTEMMAGTELLRIANLDVMEVTVDVNENDIVKISINDTADIEVDAYLNKKFLGVVTEIANSATSTGLSADQVTNFKVKIRILQTSYADLINANNKFPFRPGMSATVDIRTNAAINVICVPLMAVTTRPDSASALQVKPGAKDDDDRSTSDITLKEVVFVYKDGKAVMKNVVTGLQDSFFIEIKDGLTENEEVISAPNSLISKMLKDGMTVTKVDKNALFSETKPK